MNQKARPLLFRCKLICRDLSVALKAEFGDGVDQTAILRTELGHSKWRIALKSQVCNGLAEIAVIMTNLVHGVAQYK